MKLRPFRNNVMFKFLDGTSGLKGTFTDTRASGIIIPQAASTQKVARWGEVVASGPKSAVKPGDFILIEALMWMEGVKVDDEKIWKTDDTKILATTNDRASCQSQVK